MVMYFRVYGITFGRIRAVVGSLFAICFVAKHYETVIGYLRGQLFSCTKHTTPVRPLLHTYQVFSCSVYMRTNNEEQRLRSEPSRAVILKYDAPSTEIVCSNNATVAVVVHSSARNFEQRKRLRHLFRAFSDLARPIFVIATKNIDANLIKKLEREHAKFDDLLRIRNIKEHYHNMAFKTRAWIIVLAQYASQRYCCAIKFVVKLDDDVYVEVVELAALLKRFRAQRRVVMCRVFPNGQITRNPASKWYLSEEEYRPSSLGLYCQGMAFVISADLLPELRDNIERVQYLWMDDWYVTHALMNGTRAVFFDIAPHAVTTNSVDELHEELARRHHGRGHAAMVPIFAHFRPDTAYSLAEKAKIWTALTESFRNCS